MIDDKINKTIARWSNDRSPAPAIYVHSASNMERAESFILDGKAHPSAVTDERRLFRDELAREMKCAWYDSARLLKATPIQRAHALYRVIEKIKKDRPYCIGNEVEDIEAFKKLDKWEISLWFGTVDRPMSTAESEWSDHMDYLEMMRSR